MADEEKNENVEETPAEEAPVDDAGGDSSSEAAESASSEEVSADAPAEDAPAQDASDGEASGAADGGEGEGEEPTSPRAIRKHARATKKRRPGPKLSPEERAKARLELRKKKAVSRRAYRAKLREQKRERGPREGTPAAVKEPGSKRVRQGVVVSSKADKTITVQIAKQESHPVYKKVVRSSTKLHAHDERNEANEGDTVRVIESRPLSRTKRWRLVEVVERAR